MTRAAEDIVEWIVNAGLSGLTQAELMAGYCEHIVAAGMTLWRASMGTETLHPLIAAQGPRWRAGEGVHEEFYARANTLQLEERRRQGLLSVLGLFGRGILTARGEQVAL